VWPAFLGFVGLWDRVKLWHKLLRSKAGFLLLLLLLLPGTSPPFTASHPLSSPPAESTWLHFTFMWRARNVLAGEIKIQIQRYAESAQIQAHL